MDFIEGRQERLSQRLRERYGFTKEEAENEVLRWYARIDPTYS
jgi:uncharacterized protein YjbJ (UPF0337 family)